MKLPRELGPIHFIVIGGIGMSGIAEVLLNQGYAVQGSDASENANVLRLRERGASVHVGHHADNIGKAEVVVVSTAIRRDNPELTAAREKRLPVVRRAEMLAELMRLKRERMVKLQPPPSLRRCLMRAVLTRRSSTAASSTHTAPMRDWARASGWWWKPMRATAHF